MAPASPARLYASAVGALLVVLGILGFFEDLSWLNFLHVGTGALALLLAGSAPRLCTLVLGLVYLALALWDPSAGEAWMQWLHLVLGLLGLAAAAGTPSRGSFGTRDVTKEPRDEERPSEPRAQAAAKRL